MAKAATKFRGKTFDQSFMGPEPDLQGNITQSDLIKAYTWYQYFHDGDDAKKFVIDYLRETKANKDVIRNVSKINSNDLKTIGWNFRILSLGGNLPDDVKTRSFEKLKSLFLIESTKKEEIEPDKNKFVVSIQDRISNLTSNLIAELEEQIDIFATNGGNDFDIAKWLREKDVKPQIALKIAEKYKPLYSEIFDTIQNKDPQLKEAYSCWKKADLKKFMEFVRGFIAESEKRASIIKSIRKPRKKKEKPAALQIAKLKYQEKDDSLGLVSIKPTEVIGSNQLWTFNTKTRMLTVYNAMSATGLSVKGTSILGLDEKTSISKKLRKPELAKSVVDAGKVSLRKIMDSIRAKEKIAKNRINSDTILLRTIK